MTDQVAMSTQPGLFDPPEGEPPAGNAIVDDEFYLVVCTEAMEYRRGVVHLTRGYKHVHETEESANKEAMRLATLYRGYAFAVVKSCAIVSFDQSLQRPRWTECSAPRWRKQPW